MVVDSSNDADDKALGRHVISSHETPVKLTYNDAKNVEVSTKTKIRRWENDGIEGYVHCARRKSHLDYEFESCSLSGGRCTAQKRGGKELDCRAPMSFAYNCNHWINSTGPRKVSYREPVPITKGRGGFSSGPAQEGSFKGLHQRNDRRNSYHGVGWCDYGRNGPGKAFPSGRVGSTVVVADFSPEVCRFMGAVGSFDAERYVEWGNATLLDTLRSALGS
ncbi:hypothetical protein BDM02DRAFT_3129500 [Thelephora ganbajun]|uniref:Uncharacterized protein n=1 Tax=Thelephora ganbajun TaxID=370292 RepID=A0ACB6ZEL2_THEGA|nr:hypothetical protein BDM02DRAFT_3129500 [Thelephora ganbajun]